MTEDRLGRLDDLYDAACDVLADMTKSPYLVELQDGNLKDVAFGVIDRWLAARDADRSHELQREKADMGSELGTKIGDLLVEIVNGNATS